MNTHRLPAPAQCAAPAADECMKLSLQWATVIRGINWFNENEKQLIFFSSQCRIYTFYIFKNAIIMLEADSRFARRLHCPLPSPTRAR